MKRILVSLLLLAGAAGWSGAQTAAGNEFRQGKSRVSVTGGIGGTDGQTTGILGVGAGYYLLDGFEVGLDGEAWFGDPRVYKVSPGARYIFLGLERFKPYAGAFYRRQIYEGPDPDFDSLGGRAGAYFPVSANVYASGGIAYEQLLNCDDTPSRDCTSVYPEASLNLTF